MSLFALSQILATIAIGFNLLSFQFRERRKIIACLTVACLFITVHFALLGHWTATGVGGLATVRFIVSYRASSKKVMTLFIAASLVVAALTFHGILSVLSCLGSIFGTIGSFCTDNKRLRQMFMAASGLWLLHNILAGTPVAVLTEILFLTGNLLGYYRYYLREKEKAGPNRSGEVRNDV
jgi:hypothetical protein